MQKLGEAKPVLEKAVKDEPGDAHAWFNLGLYYRNASDEEAALEAFRRVTEIDPNDADSWYFLGATYAQLKKFPEAIAAFEHALKIDALHASAQFGMARAYQQSGDTDSALRRDEEVPVHYAEQIGHADQPGVWRAGKIFAGGGFTAGGAEGAAADCGEVCGCDGGGGD